LKEVAHSQSLHLTNLRKAMRLRFLKLSPNTNLLRRPPKGGLQGGQKDKPDQMFKEVAHSQSLHLTNLQQAMRLRGLKLSQKEHLRQAPARWEDHAWATVMHCMSEKQLGATATCYAATCLQYVAVVAVGVVGAILPQSGELLSGGAVRADDRKKVWNGSTWQATGNVWFGAGPARNHKSRATKRQNAATGN
jgi:hypothetical protein